MNKEILFETIKNNCSDESEYIFELLRFRGFLINNDNKLSDNSHHQDEIYLNQLLQICYIGHISDQGIIIEHPENHILLLNEFDKTNQISQVSCWEERSWRLFKNRIHGFKCPVSVLEPFIARYIKAISACGLITIGSCDGNHQNKYEMKIMFDGVGNIPWHKVLCEKCLNDKFRIPWNENYTSIALIPDVKYDIYYEVNKAAEYLYKKRKTLRNIKRETFNKIPKSHLKRNYIGNIEAEFIEIAKDLIDLHNSELELR